MMYTHSTDSGQITMLADAPAVQPMAQALFQALPLGICLVDALGCIVALNAEGERLLGWSTAACRGQEFHDLVACWSPVTDTTPATCPTAWVLESKRPLSLACTTLRCRDGSPLPVEYTCMPLDVHAGSGVAVSFRDLRTQLQLERDLQRLASVPEESPLPIVELDKDMHLTYANTAMLELLNRHGFNQQALPAILPEDIASIVRQCLHSGRSREGLESRAAGQYFSWTFCPVTLAGIVRGYGVDLTERRQAEEVLQASRDALLEAWRLKSEFVANISHELRTPLNGILGLTQLVLESELDHEQRGDLQAIQESAEQLLGLVTGLLDFAALESGKLALATQTFSLRAALQTILPTVQQQAQRKGLGLRVEIVPTVPETLQGDVERLQQILLSLLHNAIKFTSAGEITVRVALATWTGQRVGLHWTVHDTGIGVTEEQRRFIFDAFRQGDGSSTRLYGGVGLGLSIAAQLVTLMGGELWVESPGPGLGSVFHFTACFGVPETSVLQSLPAASGHHEAGAMSLTPES